MSLGQCLPLRRRASGPILGIRGVPSRPAIATSSFSLYLMVWCESHLPTPYAAMYARWLTSFCAEGGKPMAETSPTQLINDWLAAAKSATKENAPTVAKTLAGYYTSDAVLCAAEGIIK